MINRVLFGKIEWIRQSDFFRIIEFVGGIEKLYSLPNDYWTDPEALGKFTRKRVKIDEIKEKCKRIVQSCEDNRISVVSCFDIDYPVLLREISSYPKTLYVKGEICPTERCISIVGSRASTAYGQMLAEKIAYGLVDNGYTVVSGVARGIDTYAHVGALHACKSGKGRTIGVLGCGLNIVYPPENDCLYRLIEEKGALVSEYEPDMSPRQLNFPARNRIISGLSIGTVIVEAGKVSGSLITASLAGEQGREVFAVPGDITKNMSVGTNSLIKDGATPVCSVNDIIDVASKVELCEPKRERKEYSGKTKGGKQFRIEADGKTDAFARESEDNFQGLINECLSLEEEIIMKEIHNDGSLNTDDLSDRLGLHVSEVNVMTSLLEFRGLLKKDNSGFFTLPLMKKNKS